MRGITPSSLHQCLQNKWKNDLTEITCSLKIYIISIFSDFTIIYLNITEVYFILNYWSFILNKWLNKNNCLQHAPENDNLLFTLFSPDYNITTLN
jgi:hypothetical protein